jgi:hypothetical protein
MFPVANFTMNVPGAQKQQIKKSVKRFTPKRGAVEKAAKGVFYWVVVHLKWIREAQRYKLGHY